METGQLVGYAVNVSRSMFMLSWGRINTYRDGDQASIT